jgi:hypothetical protein
MMTRPDDSRTRGRDLQPAKARAASATIWTLSQKFKFRNAKVRDTRNFPLLAQSAEYADGQKREAGQGSQPANQGVKNTMKPQNTMTQTLDTRPRTKLRLAEVERLIKQHRIIVPPLSRRLLTKMCEEGRFETVGTKPTALGWLVYEDSFWKWVKGLDA